LHVPYVHKFTLVRIFQNALCFCNILFQHGNNIGCFAAISVILSVQ
jgi:hypothetical protein